MIEFTEKYDLEPSCNELSKLVFKDLIELDELQNMLDVSYAATGMPSGIIDAKNGEVYAGAGWQRICVQFHRANHESNLNCIASDTAIVNKIKDDAFCGYKCANGLWGHRRTYSL